MCMCAALCQCGGHSKLSVHAWDLNLLAGLFGKQEDLCAPYGFGHLVLLGCELFTDGL